MLLESEPAFAHCFNEVNAFLLLAKGLDNLQISAHLDLTKKTVRNKVFTVFDKLEVATRAQAIGRAREAGFGVSSLLR